MRFALVTVLFLLIVPIGGIILQIFLSKKESKWPGLILPIISFAFSLMVLSGNLLFSVHTGTTTLMENGEVIEQTTTQVVDDTMIIVTSVYVFVLYNIPTVVLLAIYTACRGKRKRQRDLEKMTVQDL
jgi:hypothetical protein